MALHKSSAWPLALAYAGLIAYASLYPFEGWRDQGVGPLMFLASPWPRYWTWFDLVANMVGYAPLGFLLSVAQRRTAPPGSAGSWTWLAAVALSLGMESLQSYLPSRVASNVDLALNALGAAIGALVAAGLDRAGLLARWSRWRAKWLVEPARGALVWLALWPVALLFPAAVPLGLGQVLERVESSVSAVLQGTPFLEWVPLREVELQPLWPGAELLCVMLGLVVPCLLAYSVARSLAGRLASTLLVGTIGLLASGLSAALSYGPEHAWAWLSLPVQVGYGVGLVVAAGLLPVGRRACMVLALVALCLQLSVLNNAPTGAYFAQTLQTWEQGRFIRFHGLVQWLGWLWPFGVLAYLVARLSRRGGQN